MKKTEEESTLILFIDNSEPGKNWALKQYYKRKISLYGNQEEQRHF